MSKEEYMLKLLRKYMGDEDLIDMIAHLRNYLNVDLLSEKNQYDITGEIVSGPEHVIYHVSDYILVLEGESKRLRERVEHYEDVFHLYDYWYRVAYEQNNRLREVLENTQVAIQKNLSKAQYKDEVILFAAWTDNKKVLEGAE